VKAALILTASFGEGHNAAARNLSQALRALPPAPETIVSDPFLDTYGWVSHLAQSSYLAMINYAPVVWQYVFNLLDRTQLLEQHMGVYGAAAKRLENLIDALRPEVVVSVYPGCNHLLDRIYRRRLKRPFKTVTIVTDSVSINSVWYRAHSDFFVVANEPTAKVMAAAGVPAAKIHTLGFPVPAAFATLPGQRPLPAPGERWKVLYVVNSGRHLAPAIVKHLLDLDEVELSVAVGRDEALGKQIAAIAGNRPIQLYGWTPEMPALMARSHLLIGKAGGATVQETLAARTPMIITQIIPGQEEGNAILILENNAGAFAARPAEIAAAVRRAFASHGAVWKEWLASATSLGHPDASRQIADFVIGIANQP